MKTRTNPNAHALNFADVLPSSFKATANNSECWLDLELNANNRLIGSFHAENERLEVHGNIPNAFGEIFGVLRSPELEEPVAVFRARLKDTNTLEFEIDLPDPHDLMALANAEKISFVRVGNIGHLTRHTRSNITRLELRA